MSEATPKKHPNLYKRVTASVPLLVTVIVHVVLIGVAGYFVVSEQIIGKKKTFEAVAATESVVQKQVEHRLQVARKGGGSASSSPVSASRIFSTAENALQMPAMPDLPSVGASSLSGMGFGKGMGAVGTGTGYNTGIGNGSGLGRGFMTLSFLGTTSQRASKIVFIVDVGRDLLDIRKGGFDAFKIIRDEIMKLVSRLPPSAEFGVVFYERYNWNRNAVAALAPTLLPATAANKQEFFDWMTPVNANPDRTGLSSIVGHRVNWKPKDLANAGIDPTLNVQEWVDALRFVLEMEPDTVYVISGSMGEATRKVSESELARRKRENDEYLADLKREGLEMDAVAAARTRASAKARAELDAINVKLRAAGKAPLIITSTKRIFDADFQATLKRLGYSITLDTTGWKTKAGKVLWWTGYVDWSRADFDEVIMHVSKLQRALLKDRAALNYFLFVGPDEKPQAAMDELSKFTGRNGGKFQLLTTRQLQEMSSREANK
jgi:hypothetical protein